MEVNIRFLKKKTQSFLPIYMITISSFREILQSKSEISLPYNILFSLSLDIVKPSFKDKAGFSSADLMSQNI